MAGLYIHIPFCRQVCRYCDFHFRVNLSQIDDIVDAIGIEIAMQKDYLDSCVLDTVYFGGGTPSLLEERHFHRIVGSLNAHFLLTPSCEVTLEANPDDLSLSKLNMYREAGINRLSIGVQSFSDEILAFLNRSHDASTALRSIEQARSVGFDNLNLDLMYAIPKQSHDVWNRSIEIALQLQPKHLSAYSLTLERKTVFGHWLSHNRITPFDEGDGAKQFEHLVKMLEGDGYEHYEISNFCQPGLYSTHNSNYWKQEPYLGVGPSAHSFNGLSRQFNIRNNSLYINSIRRQKVPYKKELLSWTDHVNEYIFTSLRTMWGCDFMKLKNEHDVDMYKLHCEYIHSLEDMELAFMKGGRLLLTLKGKLLADKIISDLFFSP